MMEPTTPQKATFTGGKCLISQYLCLSHCLPELPVCLALLFCEALSLETCLILEHQLAACLSHPNGSSLYSTTAQKCILVVDTCCYITVHSSRYDLSSSSGESSPELSPINKRASYRSSSATTASSRVKKPPLDASPGYNSSEEYDGSLNRFPYLDPEVAGLLVVLCNVMLQF